MAVKGWPGCCKPYPCRRRECPWYPRCFFCHQACDGSHGCLPAAPAQRSEDPGNGPANGSQNAGIDLVFSQHSELAIHKTKVRGEPNDNGGKQNDGALLFNKATSPAPTLPRSTLPTVGQVISR